MAKQVKVAPPGTVNPKPVTPKPIKPKPIEPAKAHAHGANCVRCNNAASTVRSLCFACALVLETMHWNIEHVLFRRTFYLPEPERATPPLSWLKANGYEITKPPKPRQNNTPQPEAAQSMAC